MGPHMPTVLVFDHGHIPHHLPRLRGASGLVYRDPADLRRDMSGHITITADEWKLRALQGDKRQRDRWIGLWLEKGLWVATDGSMLVTRKTSNIDAPEGWRFEFQHPAKLRSGEIIEIPREPGVHAVLRSCGRAAVVVIHSGCGAPPNWRGMTNEWRSKDRSNTLGLDPALIAAFAKASGCGKHLRFYPADGEQLSGATYESSDVFGIIMPVRLD